MFEKQGVMRCIVKHLDAASRGSQDLMSAKAHHGEIMHGNHEQNSERKPQALSRFTTL